MQNVTYLWQPKYKSPFNDGEVYFAPAVKTSQPVNGYTYIIVCCSPTWNGLWKVPEEVVYKAKRWLNNHKTVCLWVKVSDCEFVKPLEELENPKIIEKVKKTQEDYKTFRKKAKLASQDTLN